jgi:UDP-N-acetylglucosamine--N-acetylmuramyl-(pentapeptide) pyrophosphoryl-undecaprenol N-acetylglucosamine transferase
VSGAAVPRFVLAAGGTGGHLTPAFALAHELERRGHHVALITDKRGAEIPGKPDFLPAHVLPAGRFGKNPLSWPKGIAAVLEGRRMALRLFESFEPSAVVGFGGYPALPALLAAKSAGIASVVHEQNAVLGRVNRLLAGRVNAIATAYPDVDRLKPKYLEKVHLVGNPVRPEVLALRDEPFPAFTDEGLLRVLVTGGSQGARVLSGSSPMAWRCSSPRCAAACKSRSNAAPRISTRCGRATPATTFPPSSALTSRTCRRGSPTRTCSSAVRGPRRSPS